jgi:integrase
MKRKLNPENERIKLTYFHFLENADGKAKTTIRQVEKAIRRFEDYTNSACFKTFNQKQAVGFKDFLTKQEIALATSLTTTNNLKRFLGWLAMQPGYKSKIKQNDIAYLSLPEKDVRAAQAPADKSTPTLLMIEMAVRKMPSNTPIEKRNRAMIALLALTATRVGALITLKIKHFDQSNMVILQNPLEVSTKFSKRIDAFICPFNTYLENVFLDWVTFLKDAQLFADIDPLFPKTAIGQDTNNFFIADGLSRQHWATTSPVRSILRQAFDETNIPRHTPHRFRNMLVNEAYDRGLSVAEMKALSQNLGHESPMTTLKSYGKIPVEQQGKLIRGIASKPEDKPVTQAQLRELLSRLDPKRPDGAI